MLRQAAILTGASVLDRRRPWYHHSAERCAWAVRRAAAVELFRPSRIYQFSPFPKGWEMEDRPQRWLRPSVGAVLSYVRISCDRLSRDRLSPVARCWKR